MEYTTIIKTLEKTYKVEDILFSDVKIVFVLESPHVQELIYRAPVSGSSGATMTKTLFGQNETLPFGRFLKEKHGVSPYNTIGLMNICQIPMQVKAYQNPKLEKALMEFFQRLEKVRTTNDKVAYKDIELNRLQGVILHDFIERLKTFEQQDVVFVPCGRFAEKFFRLADPKNQLNILQGVPHPSYNSWSKEKYASSINELKKVVYAKMDRKSTE